MKQISTYFNLSCMVIAISFFTTELSAQEKTTHPSNLGSWRRLGTVEATYSTDHDEIQVTGSNDNYRKFKFYVTGAPLKVHKLFVTFDNGQTQEFNTRFDIPEGGESRLFDFNGGVRSLKKIDFWYETKGWTRGKAKVSVYALK
jgi:hypothetical protein